MIATEVTAEVRHLADALAQVPVGGVMTLDAMSQTVGRNIVTNRHLAYSAMKLVRGEIGAVFVTVRGEGYRRLDAIQVPEVIGTCARSRIRSTSRRAKRTIEAGIAFSNSLPPDVQRRAAAEISALGLLEHIAKDKAVLPDATTPLKPEPVAITAQRFLSRIGAVR